MKSILHLIKFVTFSEKNNSSKFLNLYILKSQTTAQFFKLKIGSETIATNYVLEKILNETETDENLKQQTKMQIYINNEIKQKYIKKIAEEREQIGWSLLTALTFAYLVKNQFQIQ